MSALYIKQQSLSEPTSCFCTKCVESVCVMVMHKRAELCCIILKMQLLFSIVICYKNGWFIRVKKDCLYFSQNQPQVLPWPGDLPTVDSLFGHLVNVAKLLSPCGTCLQNQEAVLCQQVVQEAVTVLCLSGHVLTQRRAPDSQKIQTQVSFSIFTDFIFSLFNVSKASASSCFPNPINMMLPMIELPAGLWTVKWSVSLPAKLCFRARGLI